MSRQPGSLYTKDPNSDEPQGFDWTAYLTELGTTINTSTWFIAGPDAVLTKHDPTVLAGNLRTQVYLAVGTPGARYTVTNRIVTNNSPAVTDDRSFYVLVQDQ